MEANSCKMQKTIITINVGRVSEDKVKEIMKELLSVLRQNRVCKSKGHILCPRKIRSIKLNTKTRFS